MISAFFLLLVEFCGILELYGPIQGSHASFYNNRMKKLFCILLFLFPVVVFAQQHWYRYSPMDYAWKDVGTAGFSSAEADYISLAFSPYGEPYVAYSDLGNYNQGAATVMMFNGTEWVNVGNAGFSAGEVWYTSLAFSPSGQPYVAYEDGGNSFKATVMRFNGTNWVNVGNAGFSAGEAAWTSLAFSPADEQPYVAFEDYGNSLKATVMRFNGTNWVNAGNAGFSAGSARETCLAFSQTSEPYVAYSDGSNSSKAFVKKFDGTNWVNVGNAGFSGPNAYSPSLAFNPSDGQPYLAYLYIPGPLTFGPPTVMKFDGTNWVDVGDIQFTSLWSEYIKLAFDPAGEPFVAFCDDNILFKGTVMKFDGTNWVDVGTAGFTAGMANYISLTFSTSGQACVAYSDGGVSWEATVMKYDSVYDGINELQGSGIKLYPNPATDKITVETSATPAINQLTIMDLNGQELITRQITEPKTQIDISSLPSGVYFVRLTKDKTVEVGKFVKE
jgi:hypothetical protein